MIRWFDPSVNIWIKFGDLEMHFETLMKHFPFEILLFDSKSNPK